MIAIPAVELRDTPSMRTLAAARSDASEGSADSSLTARALAHMGFTYLQLDSLGRAPHRQTGTTAIEDFVRDTEAKIQVVGPNSTFAVEQLFRCGAEHVVLGARAFDDPDWLADLAELYPESIVVAVDIRGQRVVRRGSVRPLPDDVLDLVEELDALPLAGILLSGLRLEQPDRRSHLSLIEEVVERSRSPVMVSARPGTTDDLRALEHRGAAAVVLNADQLLRGGLDARAIAQEFGA